MRVGLTVIAAIASNAATTVIKGIAAAVTGSSAMLSESVHSLVDTGDSILLLVGKLRSQKPPDRGHALGYGRELYFWSMVVSMIIFGAGGCINMFEGVTRIIHPKPAEHVLWSYIVLGCAAILDGASFTVGYKQFRKEYRHGGFFAGLRQSKDPTTFAVVLEDGSDLLGMTVAFLGIWLGQRYHLPVLEGIASVIIGGILASVAFLLGRECHGLLIGESADKALLERITQAALVSDGVEQVGDPVTMYFGPHDIMLALPVRFLPDLDAKSLAATIDKMETSIRKEAPDVKRMFIEAELRFDDVV